MKKPATPALVFGGLVLFVVLGIGASFFVEKSGDKGLVPTDMPPIGGSFTLTGHTGATITDRTFRGKYMLIFFGYTFCPDVCPTTITTITDMMDILGPEKAEKIVPVFVSVDYERDTPEALGQYVANFHPAFVGATGTKEQIEDIARKYRVYYAKAKQEGASDDDIYLIDHSAVTYLMGPDGKYVKHFPYGISPEVMARRIDAILAGAG